jgi:hypothetical protein
VSTSGPDDELARWMGALGDEHMEGFGPAVQWLVEHGERARPALREVLAAGGIDMATRRAFDVLGRIGHAADVAVLAGRLAEARGTLAADAAHGLALHRDAAAFDAQVAATRSEHPDVAGAAASGLGERGDVAARPALEALRDHASSGVGHRAELALRELASR